MKTAFVYIMLCCSAFSEQIALITHQSANSPEFKAGLTNWWPRTEIKVSDDYVLSQEMFALGWEKMTVDAWRALKDANRSAYDAWVQRMIQTQKGQEVAGQLKFRLTAGDFAELKLDALQSEFVGKLLHAYLQSTELLLLVTKAVAGSTLTNNLSAAERARVVALRPQLVFPQQADFTQADRDRAVAIRDTVLIPHYQLYQAAKNLVELAKTNSTPVDVTSATNWPAVTIGD